MSKTRMRYFEKEDILHISISEEEECNSVELTPNITAELNEQNEIIGLEILDASTFIQESLFDSMQIKLMNLVKAP